MPQDTIEETSGPPRLKEGQKYYKKFRESTYEKTYREGSSEDFHYFTGEDQGWDDKSARSDLEDVGRPALTLNHVNSIIRLICGARPQTEAKYLPVEEGDTETADILGACKDHVEDQSRMEFLANDIFLHGCVLRRAVIELRPQYPHNEPQGEIELVFRDGREFYLDPNSKRKDRKDMERMFEELHVTPEQAKRAFPKKKNQIDDYVVATKEGDENESTSRDSGAPDEYTDPKAYYYDKGSDTLKIIVYWYKDYESATKIIDTVSGSVFDSPKPAEQVEKEIAKLSKAPERFQLLEKQFIRVRYLIFCADLILEEGVTPWERPDGLPTDLSEDFPFVIFEPDRLFVGTRQELISLVNPLKDPQKYYNKLASAVLEIIGTQANSGTDYEEGAAEPDWEEKLKKFGSKPGFNMKWNTGALAENRVHYRQPGSPPQGHIIGARDLYKSLLDISGVESLINTETLGKQASGVAIDLKQRQGGNIIQWLYASFRFFQHLLADKERDAIQMQFDYEKVIRIKGHKPRYVRVNEAVYDEMGAITTVLNDVTTGRYDVTVSDKELMPTMRIERFKYFVELVKSGALVLPPEVMTKIVLTLMDDPELKTIVEDEMADFYQAAQAAMGPGGMPMQQAAA